MYQFGIPRTPIGGFDMPAWRQEAYFDWRFVLLLPCVQRLGLVSAFVVLVFTSVNAKRRISHRTGAHAGPMQISLLQDGF